MMKIVPLNGAHAWAIIAYYITRNRNFGSVTGIIYQAELRDDSLFYKGGKRNSGEEEMIGREEFVSAFDSIRNLNEINTNLIKGHIPNSLYRKRTPFIGLLKSAELIR